MRSPADQLRHVYWLGGGSGAGKSTVARRLAAVHGLHHYATDDTMSDHAKRASAVEAPELSRFIAMSMDERWLDRSPEEMLATFHWFRGEAFELIVADLLALPAEPGVIVDGFRLLPHLVVPLLADPRQAMWLLPSPGFRQRAFEHRGSLWTIAEQTSDPPRALRNLLERDHLFTERVRVEAYQLNQNVIEVDGGLTEDDLTDRVAAAFGLPRP
jgi:hypothetical protein